MKSKTRYSIGDVSDMCRVSKKALRYYDKIGLISSKRQDFNNYRYYTSDALLIVPIIKYYKQMGFTLDEMRELIEGKSINVHRALQKSFLSKIKELEKEQEELQRKYASVSNWYDLILEAEQVIDNEITGVSARFVERSELLYQEQMFENDIKASVINIEFTNYLQDISNEIAGPIILKFSSYKSRIKNEHQPIVIMQKPLLPCDANLKTTYGGYMMASCYHIGPHETIGETYNKICSWAKSKEHLLSEESYERYVTDYWTAQDPNKFVTEILIRILQRVN